MSLSKKEEINKIITDVLKKAVNQLNFQEQEEKFELYLKTKISEATKRDGIKRKLTKDKDRNLVINEYRILPKSAEYIKINIGKMKEF